MVINKYQTHFFQNIAIDIPYYGAKQVYES